MAPSLSAGAAALTLMMPASVAGSLALMMTSPHPFEWMLPVCGFYWTWALKNRTMGPILIDGGVVSFLPGLVVGALAKFSSSDDDPSPLLCGAAAASCTLVALNFWIPVRRFMKTKTPYPHNAYPREKPNWWAAVFHAYCHLSLLFWSVGAANSVAASSDSPRAGCFAFAGVASLAIVVPAIIRSMNAPILKAIKEAKAKAAK